VREIRSRGEHDMDLRGFVDDDPLKQGAVINGLKVLGSSEALPTLVPALGIDQVIITIAEAPQGQLRRIVQICERIPVKAQMIPPMYDLLRGRCRSRSCVRCGSRTCWNARRCRSRSTTSSGSWAARW